jgi:hypothetical protein
LHAPELNALILTVWPKSSLEFICCKTTYPETKKEQKCEKLLSKKKDRKKKSYAPFHYDTK